MNPTQSSPAIQPKSNHSSASNSMQSAICSRDQPISSFKYAIIEDSSPSLELWVSLARSLNAGTNVSQEIVSEPGIVHKKDFALRIHPVSKKSESVRVRKKGDHFR